jgi:hypothetical protein
MKIPIASIIIMLFAQTGFSQIVIKDSLITLTKNKRPDPSTTRKEDSLPHATFYFYRSYIPKFNVPLKKVPVYINDSLAYNLSANSIITFTIFKEGKYNIAVDKKRESEIQTRVKFGKEYYFKCEVFGGLLNGRITVESVTPAFGREDTGILKSE